MYSPTTGPRTR
jgi:hypothetical protein